MKSRYFFRPGSSFQVGSAGSLPYWTLITPLDASRPAGCSVALTGLALMSRMCTGFQLSSWIFRIACAACFGVEAL